MPTLFHNFPKPVPKRGWLADAAQYALQTGAGKGWDDRWAFISSWVDL